MSKKNWILLLSLSVALGLLVPAYAQVAGTTKETDSKVVESTQIAKGWSAKRSVIGQKLYKRFG